MDFSIPRRYLRKSYIEIEMTKEVIHLKCIRIKGKKTKNENTKK